MILRRDFFARTTEVIAQELLGAFLVHDLPYGRVVGRIVETEAYLSDGDPACHAHKGMTNRNASMFGPAGRAYVYLVYGMYYCFNVVTAEKGKGEAVLIRALEPIEGISLMERHRNTSDLKTLCNGPGKLVMAMGIDKRHDGQTLMSGALKLMSSDSSEFQKYNSQEIDILRTTRIGISKGTELPLRYYIRDCNFISKK
ncbi:MAG: DNA-3-methyladenine glycosylase [Deltaproteobacteria bacterium]|nr:DNA-3-methyladenine glycosylase [Deltaproteobacteria bacterium]